MSFFLDLYVSNHFDYPLISRLCLRIVEEEEEEEEEEEKEEQENSVRMKRWKMMEVVER